MNLVIREIREGHSIVSIQHATKNVLNIKVIDNSPEQFLTALLLAEHKQELGIIEQIIGLSSELCNQYERRCDSSIGEFLLHFIKASLQFLEDERRCELKNRYLEQYAALKSFMYEIYLLFDRDKEKFRVSFYNEKKAVVHLQFPRNKIESVQDGTVVEEEFYVAIASEYSDSRKRKAIELLIENLPSLVMDSGLKTEGLDLLDDKAKQTLARKLRVNLLKAIVLFLENYQDAFITFFPHLPKICAYVVENGEDIEEERHYLERIDRYERTEDQKDELFKYVSDRLEAREVYPGKAQRVISNISEYYLGLYDLDRAAEYLHRLKDKGPLLEVITFIYKHILIICPISIFLYFSSAYRLMSNYPLLLILTLIASVSTILFLVYVIVRKEILYIRLLFPRLLGAIVVGFSVLVPQDVPWKWTEPSLTILLGSVAAYLAAFVYVFLEVESTLRFVKNRSLKDVLVSTFKVYSIGLMEAIFIATLTIVLFASAVEDAPKVSGSLVIDLGLLKIPSLSLSIGDMGASPTLVFVWAGVALFIAAFAQLLWQGKKITESL